MPAVILINGISRSSIFSLEHILPCSKIHFKTRKSVKRLWYNNYIRVLKVQCTRSSKFNIQTRAAVAMQVLSSVVFILVEEVLRGQIKLSLESFIFWPTKQSSA